MFFILFTFCSSSIIGIDLGYNYLKASVLSKEKPLHFAINTNSKRLTPNYFAFWNRTKSSNYSSLDLWNETTANEFEWAFGDVAREQCLRFPKLCLRGLPVLNNEKFYTLRGYEIAALSLKSFIQSIIEAEKINDSVQVIVAIPPLMDPRQKSFLYAALSILKLEVVQFIDSTTGPSYVYGLERYKGEKDKVVAFVDIGAKGTRVSIFNFDNSTGIVNITQLAVQCNESIGGINLDAKLAENVAMKHNVNMNNIKTKFNFLDDISMVKEMLTNHPSVDLKFEEDDEDEKLITIKRNELNEIGGEMNATLETLIRKAIIQSNINLNNTNITVEMIGGCSHIQFIEETVKSAFNVSKLSHTLNANSVIAISAGYIGAERSKQFIVRPTNKSFMITQPIVLKTNHQIYKIFNQGDMEDSSSVVQATVSPSQQFSIENGNTFQPYMKFSINNLTKPANVELSFIHNYYLMPNPLSATLASNNNNLEINYDTVGWEVSTEELIKSGHRVSNLLYLQQQRRLKEIAANRCEEELFKLQNFLRVAENISEEEIEIIKDVIKDGLDWFENISLPEEIKLSIETYQKKLGEIVNKTEAIVQKGTENSKRRLLFKKIKKTIDKSSKLLEQSLSVGNVNTTLQDDLIKAVDDAKNWLVKSEEKIESVSSKEIEEKRNQLKNALIPLKNNIKSILKKLKKKDEEKEYNDL